MRSQSWFEFFTFAESVPRPLPSWPGRGANASSVGDGGATIGGRETFPPRGDDGGAGVNGGRLLDTFGAAVSPLASGAAGFASAGDEPSPPEASADCSASPFAPPVLSVWFRTTR